MPLSTHWVRHPRSDHRRQGWQIWLWSHVTDDVITGAGDEAVPHGLCDFSLPPPSKTGTETRRAIVPLAGQTPVSTSASEMEELHHSRDSTGLITRNKLNQLLKVEKIP
jgi:hypothetical protein